MNKSSINKLKKRLLGIVTATSIAVGGLSPAAGLTAGAAENTELSQISGFKQGWSWVIGTEAAAIDELQSAEALSKST